MEEFERYLFSQQIDGLLNISKIHPFYISDYRNHQTLREESCYPPECILPQTPLSYQAPIILTFGVATATLMST